MVSTQRQRPRGQFTFRTLVGLLCFLVPCAGVWAQGKRVHTEGTQQKTVTSGLYVVVHDGRLSVDLQEADMEAVLAQIGQQSGIRISSGPSAGKKVNARFSGVELEEGIRRLLRSASLNHIFMYSGKPGGPVTISEVRILGEGKPLASSPASVVESGMPPSEPPTRAPAGKGRRQAPEIAQPILEVTPEPEQGEPTEITRRVREVFQFSKGMGTKAPDAQEPASNELQ